MEKDSLEKVANQMLKHRILQRQPVKIALTGISGSGKSSLANTIRGLSVEDEGAAPVGIEETTKALKKYEWTLPNVTKIELFDLPGVGIKNFSHESYAEKTEMSRYDFFVIVSSERFTDHDAWTANKIKNMNKPFVFVKTKVDHDIANEQRCHPDTFDENCVIEKIRSYYENSLKDIDCQCETFLLNNFEPNEFDCFEFNRYLAEFTCSFSKAQQFYNMILRLKSTVQEKKTISEKKVPIFTLYSLFKSRSDLSNELENVFADFVGVFGLRERNLDSNVECTLEKVRGRLLSAKRLDSIQNKFFFQRWGIILAYQEWYNDCIHELAFVADLQATIISEKKCL